MMTPRTPPLAGPGAQQRGAASAAAGEVSVEASLDASIETSQARRRVGAFGVRRARSMGMGLVVPLLVLGAWEVAIHGGALDRTLFSSPSAVVEEVVSSARSGLLWRHLAATGGRLIAGFALGVSVATALGTVAAASIRVGKLVDPTLQSLRNIPSLAWVPLFILWLGIGETSKVLLIAVGVFFPVYLALFSGLRGLDRKLVEVGLAFRLRGWALVRRVYLPATLPAYFVGLRAGLGLGWMFVVAAEMMGASKGLGYLLVDGQATGRPGIMIAAVALFAFCGKLTDAALMVAARATLRWQDLSAVDR